MDAATEDAGIPAGPVAPPGVVASRESRSPEGAERRRREAWGKRGLQSQEREGQEVSRCSGEERREGRNTFLEALEIEKSKPRGSESRAQGYRGPQDNTGRWGLM